MVLVTVTVGYALGSAGSWQIVRLLNAVLGIVLVATSSSAFNQILERRTDALMARTRTRPLPSGRMSVREVLTFATFCGAFGLLWLLFGGQIMAGAIYDAMLQSLTAEHASRRMAMKGATDAASRMGVDLKRIYNRARQEGITKELLDIVGGTAAVQ